MDNFFFRPQASTEGPDTGSQLEINREECSCGKQFKQFKNEISGEQSEISGGKEAQSNEFPWAVRIFGGCAKGIIYLEGKWKQTGFFAQDFWI